MSEFNVNKQEIFEIIDAEGTFDYDFYVKEYDLNIREKQEAILHFINYGYYLDYAPSINISIKYTMQSNDFKYTYDNLKKIVLGECFVYSYQYEYIRDKGEFDYEWYKRIFLNEIENVDPLLHYLDKKTDVRNAPNENFSRYCYRKRMENADNESVDPYYYYLREDKDPELVKDYYYQRILLSTYFDKDKYIADNELDYDVDPVEHYLSESNYGAFVSDFFDASGYAERHIGLDMPALEHYFRYGIFENDPAALFPECANNIILKNKCNLPIKHKRVLFFAAFTRDGIIPNETLYSLRMYKSYVDCIYFVADCPLTQESANEVFEIADYVRAERHCKYDFGSYQRCWEEFRLDFRISAFDEILLVNDSIIGPLFDISRFFSQAKKSKADLYGMTINNYGYKDAESNGRSIYQPHIQSYFVILKKRFITSKCWKEFIENISKPENKKDIVIRYEMGLSQKAIDAGFSIDSFYKSSSNLNPASREYYSIAEKTGVLKKNLFEKFDDNVINYIFDKYEYPFTLRKKELISKNIDISANSCQIINGFCDDEKIIFLLRIPLKWYDRHLRMIGVDKRYMCITPCNEIQYDRYLYELLKAQMEEDGRYKLKVFNIDYKKAHLIEYYFYMVDDNMKKYDFSLLSKKHYMLNEFYVFCHDNSCIYITNSDNKLENEVNACSNIISKKALDYFNGSASKNILNGVILIAEKENYATDNAWELFKYIKGNCGWIESKVFYLVDNIEKFFADFDPNEQYRQYEDSLIERNSLRHSRLFEKASLLVYNYDYFNLIPNCFTEFQLSRMMKHKSLLCVHHGYSGGYNNSIAFGMLHRGKGISIVSSSSYETSYMKKVGFDRIFEVGYPRYDKWTINSDEDKTICVFFTFRRSNLQASEQEFIQSYYYRYIVWLMKKVTENLREYKIRYVFHNALKKYQKDFIHATLLSINSDIEFVDNEDGFTLNNSLTSSRILITDYSSIGFDFLYNSNRLSIFCVDDKFLEGHYKLSDSFIEQVTKAGGVICKNVTDVINAVCSAYKSHPQELFTYYDNNNAKRCYEVLKQIYAETIDKEKLETGSCNNFTPEFSKYIVGNGYVTLKWYMVPDAEKYNIYKKDEVGEWVLLDSINGETRYELKDKIVETGNIYQYRLSASINGKEVFCNSVLTVKYTGSLDSVGIQLGEKGIYLQWVVCEWAKKYVIYRRKSGAKWTFIKEVEGHHYIDVDVEEGFDYEYAIKAVYKKDDRGIYNMDKKMITYRRANVLIS